MESGRLCLVGTRRSYHLPLQVPGLTCCSVETQLASTHFQAKYKQIVAAAVVAAPVELKKRHAVSYAAGRCDWLMTIACRKMSHLLVHQWRCCKNSRALKQVPSSTVQKKRFAVGKKIGSTVLYA